MSIRSTVRDILRKKGSEAVWTVGPEETVFEALKKMALHNVGALLVEEHSKVIGIITERDYARKIVLRDRSSRTALVREIMEPEVLYVVPDDIAEQCMGIMTQRRIRHLPVYEGSKLLGLISMGDVVHALNSDREFLISELTRYVTNSYASSFDVLAPLTIEERILV